MSHKKTVLIGRLLEKGFQRTAEPSFKLVCGATSNFYVNCRPVALHPEGMFLIGHLIYEQVSDIADLSGIGGLTFGADPLAMATAFASLDRFKRPIKAFSIRKEQKDHGIVKWIEGDMQPGEKVVIVDDVATTGGSTIKAIERARSEGLEVVRAVILVDRQELDGMENIRRHVPDVRAIITRDELFAADKERQLITR